MVSARDVGQAAGDDAEGRVAQEIVRIARDELRLDGASAALADGRDAPLADRLDSLARLSLVVAVEDRFRIALDDEGALAVRTLGDLARLVVARAAPELLP
ncbi:acyl carrier protein [Anaeromyxobacter sp. PSR-1]|uniref:acyl carrier protein n=1 Tax=unclassified Anaeromyxobacter TaxID=2620896 RepID=UPI0005DE34AC|nr:acyl carrier protein [Anaeromyxobacter sp. PSR-1]GAO03913.1 acyl carrier protein [Anaeromyxobacter sp. PSR-1]